MIQRFLSLFFRPILLAVLMLVSAPAAAAGSAEATFAEGLDCLQRQDIDCARIALLRIPPQTTFAKILEGAIAVSDNDIDRAFRLLLPIQVSGTVADGSLLPEAVASLHSSLAQAYDSQGDHLRALEQRMLAERQWRIAGKVEGEPIRRNQTAIWQTLFGLDRARLVEMRGESLDTGIQGWIDLALALQSSHDHAATIADWKQVYPDHPADTRLVLELTPVPETAPFGDTALRRHRIALLLPFANAAFYPVADAVHQGFTAAMRIAGDTSEVVIYPTNGDKNLINTVHTQAVNDGADFVIGPLVRDEITALVTAALPGGELAVPTLALNQADASFVLKNLYSIGLSADTEAAQIAAMARDAGMQRAAILTADNGIGARLSEAFAKAWQSEGGQVVLQAGIDSEIPIDELQAQIQSLAPELILLAMDAEQGRAIRAHLDITIPVFGFSHIYTGINYEPEDAALLAVRFTDLPWVLNANDPEFLPYRSAAANLPAGTMQRLFALGADAYQVLTAIASRPGQETIIHGLTGRIRIDAQGEIERRLAIGRFEGSGVLLEQRP